MTGKLEIPSSTVTAADKVTILLESYKKHSAELLALETSNERLIAVVLGFYSAGATLIAGFIEETTLTLALRVALGAIAILVLLFAAHFSGGRNRARRGIRRLIVNIEAALDFYRDGAYLAGQSLYPRGYFRYPDWHFLNYGWLILIPACAGFIAVLIFV